MDNNILEINNLVVHYITDEGVVEAVNGLDIDLKRRDLRISWRDRAERLLLP